MHMQATLPEDRERILADIARAEGGHAALSLLIKDSIVESARLEADQALQALQEAMAAAASQPKDQADRSTTHQDQVQRWLNSLHKYGSVAIIAAQYPAAEKAFQQECECAAAMLSPLHELTLRAKNALSGAHSNQGHYSVSIPLMQEAVEGMKATLGEQHPDTLEAELDLCVMTSGLQGWGPSHEVTLRRLLSTFTALKGPQDSLTLKVSHNLALLLTESKRFEEAQQLLQHALESHTRVLGPEHPTTLFTAYSMAGVFHGLKDYARAEELHRQVLEARRHVLGEEHPGTIASMGELGRLLRDARRLKEAEEFLVRSLELKTKVLGAGHFATISSNHSVACVYLDLKQPAIAELYLRAALEGAMTLFGPEHRRTQIYTQDLEYCLGLQGKAEGPKA